MRRRIPIAFAGLLAHAVLLQACKEDSNPVSAPAAPEPSFVLRDEDPGPLAVPVGGIQISLDSLGVVLGGAPAKEVRLPNAVATNASGAATVELRTSQALPDNVLLSVDGQNTAWSVPVTPTATGFSVSLDAASSPPGATGFTLYLPADTTVALRGVLVVGAGAAPPKTGKIYMRMQFSYQDPTTERSHAASRFRITGEAFAHLGGKILPIHNSMLTVELDRSVCGITYYELGHLAAMDSLRLMRYQGAEISVDPVLAVAPFGGADCSKDTFVKEVELPFRVNDMRGILFPLDRENNWNSTLACELDLPSSCAPRVVGRYLATDWETMASGERDTFSLANFYTYPSQRGDEWKQMVTRGFGDPNRLAWEVWHMLQPDRTTAPGGSYVDHGEERPYIKFEGKNFRLCSERGGTVCQSHSKGGPYRDLWMLFSPQSDWDVPVTRNPDAAEAEIPWNESITYGSLLDSRDGRTYRTISMGGLRWMAENLDFKSERSICGGKTSDSCQRYGRLYDWAEAMGLPASANNGNYVATSTAVQGICPSGWHLPSDREWLSLEIAAGMPPSDSSFDLRGDQELSADLRAQASWDYPLAGRDKFGFRAVNAGMVTSDGTGSGRVSYAAAHFWTPSINMVRELNKSGVEIGGGRKRTDQLSVRCVEDGGTPQLPVAGNPDPMGLRELAVSAGTLTPAFSSGKLDYVDTVAFSQDRVEVSGWPSNGMNWLEISPDESRGGIRIWHQQVRMSVALIAGAPTTVYLRAVSNSSYGMVYQVTIYRKPS